MIRAKIDAEKLRGFLDCMHDEADARDKRSVAIRDIVKAAKEVGYDTKAIRKVFVRERMDEAERSKQDDLLESYEHALGGKGRALAAIAEGMPVEVAAKANGVHRATVARARHVAKQASDATPHDPETGEVHEVAQRHADRDGKEVSICGQSDARDAGTAPADIGGPGNGQDHVREDGGGVCPAGKAEAELTAVAASEKELLGASLGSAAGAGPFTAQEAVGDGIGIPDIALAIGLSEVQKSCGGVESRHAGKLGGAVPHCDSANASKAHGPTLAAGAAPGPQDIDLTIPAFLQRILA